MLGRPYKVLAGGVAAFIALACSNLAIAQTSSIALSSGASASGGAVTLNLTLTNAGAANPTDIEWTFGYPSASISSIAVSAGTSANAAGKHLDCVANSTSQTTCVLYGLDGAAVQNGVIATALIQVKSGIASTAVPISVGSAGAASVTGDAITSTGVGGSITVTSTPPALKGITCNPSASIVGPSSSICAVTLNSAATSSLSVALSSSDPVVTLPKTISIANGASSVQVTASIAAVTSTHNTVVTASAGSVTTSAALQVVAPVGSQPATKQMISGNVGTTPSGARASIAISTPGGQQIVVTSDGNGNYVTPGLASGTYTITPTKAQVIFSPASRTVSLSKVNLPGINFTSQAVVASRLRGDVQVSANQNAANNSVTTPVFSTGAPQELLLALISTDSSSGEKTMVNSVSGAGLQWSLVVRSNKQQGTAEIWKAVAPAVLRHVSVTAQLSQEVASSITVKSFVGAGAVGATGSGSSNSGAPQAGLRTTASGSIVVGVGNDYDNAIARTPTRSQQILHQFLSATGDTYWVQSLSSPVLLKGTQVVLSDVAPTSDQYNFSICEIVPAGGIQ